MNLPLKISNVQQIVDGNKQEESFWEAPERMEINFFVIR
jgi:hypothetical protein